MLAPVGEAATAAAPAAAEDSAVVSPGSPVKNIEEDGGTSDDEEATVVVVEEEDAGKPRIGAPRGLSRRKTRDRLLRHMPGARADARGFGTNHPTCLECGGAARPAILMFADSDWVDSSAQAQRYRDWCHAVKAEAQDRPLEDPLRVVVLEVGAGEHVTTVRMQSELVFKGAEGNNIRTTLVRVNPEFPLGDDPAEGHVSVLPIMARGLDVLTRIDRHIEKILAPRHRAPRCYPAPSHKSSSPTPRSSESPAK